MVRNFYYLNGRGIGDTGNDTVEFRVDYAQQLAEQETKDKKGRTSQINPNLNPRIQPVTSADFDQNFQPINDSFPAKVAGTHIVQPNETLQSIAQAMYGDAGLWYLIADANGLTNEQLVAGLRLTIPNVVANVHNNAETFRPYDVQAALGDTTPTLPAPPPPPSGKKGCGGLGTVLIIAVAVVAATFTAGAAGVLAGNLAAAAFGTSASAIAFSGAVATAVVGAASAVAAGAVFSAVSQGVLIAAGVQNKFSFKEVARGAVTQLASFGLDSVIAGSDKFAVVKKFADLNPNTYLALHGATANVLTQGISVATGLQKSFSWREVGISAVSAPVSRYAGNTAAEHIEATGRVGEVARNVGATVGGSLVRSAFGQKITSQSVLQDVGGLLGNFAANQLQESVASRSQTSAARIAAITEGEAGASNDPLALAFTGSPELDASTQVASAAATTALDSPVASSGAIPGVGDIESVEVVGRRFNYAENLEYALLRSPFSFIRADGARGGGYKDNDDDFVSQLALDRVAYDIRRSYRDAQDFEFAARNYDLFIDTVSPVAQFKRAGLDTLNAGIRTVGRSVYLGLARYDAALASAGKQYVDSFQVQYDSPLNEALAVGLSDEFAAVKGASENLIGKQATALLGETLSAVSDAATVFGAYAGFRNTGFARSLKLPRFHGDPDK